MERHTVYCGTDTALELRAANLDDYRGYLDDALIVAGIDGATITESLGYWQGQREPTFRVEIIGENLRERVQIFANAYRQRATQFEVWIVSAPVSREVVE